MMLSFIYLFLLNYYIYKKMLSIKPYILQQNVTIVTNFSEENFFVTKKYHIVTIFIFRHYI